MDGIPPGPLGSGSRPVDTRDGTNALTVSPKPGPICGPYIRGDKFSEFPPLFIDAKPPNITVEIDREDLSIGTARYTGATHINKNLAIRQRDLIPHANIKFIIRDESGHILPMTKRMVRLWLLLPDQDGTLGKGGWHKVTPEKSPFYDDGAGNDAPGEQILFQVKNGQRIFKNKEPVGQLQEFLAGNLRAGGAYYQVISLSSPDGTTRVITANLRYLNAAEFLEALRMTTSNKYRKTHTETFLFDVDFPPIDWQSDSGVVPAPAKMAKPAR
jgi:hypothetical protein